MSPVSEAELFMTLATALGLGALVGLQREHAGSEVAGIRTFPLITILGTLSGLLAATLGGWIVGVALAGVVAAMVLGNIYAVRPKDESPGTTTEIAMLVMFTIGVMLAMEMRSLAVVTTGAVVLLLHAKELLHRLVDRMGDRDVRGVMTFVLIALVVLPILPDEDYGPFGVWNPRRIWLVVVLVVGISLGGYVVYRLVGQERGAVIAGVLGGLISSTATTVSYSRRAAGNADATLPSALVIAIASCIVYGRVLTEIAVVAPAFLPLAAWPVGIMLAVGALAAAALWLWVRRQKGSIPEQKNPTELKAALIFAGMYALVIWAIAAGKAYLGESGLYAIAAISGLTDMDAITLSTAGLVSRGELNPAIAWRAIVIASMANIVFKLGIAWTLGGLRLTKAAAIPMGAQFAAGALLLAFWRAG